MLSHTGHQLNEKNGSEGVGNQAIWIRVIPSTPRFNQSWINVKQDYTGAILYTSEIKTSSNENTNL
jgi:hypothetical protein